MDTNATTHYRIALLSAEFPPDPGGIGAYTARLGAALARRGHDVAALTIAAGRMTSYALTGAGQELLAAGLPGATWGWRSWGAVRAALRLLRPDLLHIQYQTGAYGMHPAVNFLPRRLRPLPVVVTAHDLLPPYLFPKAGPLRDMVTARLLHAAAAAVVTNAPDAIHAGRWLGHQPALIPIGSNIAVLPPPGYVRDRWRAGLGVGPGQQLIAYFGLIAPNKGLDTLLDALALLPEARLAVIGGAASAPQDRAHAAAIRAQVARLGLAERVVFTGQVPDEQVSAHLLAADAAALPYTDGASFRRGSLLAALAHGVATVTTAPLDAAAVRLADAALADGENCLLVPPANPAALAAALRRLAADPALAQRLGSGGQALAAHFGWDAIAAQHEALYAKLVG